MDTFMKACSLFAMPKYQKLMNYQQASKLLLVIFMFNFPLSQTYLVKITN